MQTWHLAVASWWNQTQNSRTNCLYNQPVIWSKYYNKVTCTPLCCFQIAAQKYSSGSDITGHQNFHSSNFPRSFGKIQKIRESFEMRRVPSRSFSSRICRAETIKQYIFRTGLNAELFDSTYYHRSKIKQGSSFYPQACSTWDQTVWFLKGPRIFHYHHHFSEVSYFQVKFPFCSRLFWKQYGYCERKLKRLRAMLYKDKRNPQTYFEKARLLESWFPGRALTAQQHKWRACKTEMQRLKEKSKHMMP